MSGYLAGLQMASFGDGVRLSPQAVAAHLRDSLGGKLVAYMGSVSETRAVREWAEGTRQPPADTFARLRLAHQVLSILLVRDTEEVAQAWFMGLNPDLSDQAAATLIREGELNVVGPQILDAARAFAAQG